MHRQAVAGRSGAIHAERKRGEYGSVVRIDLVELLGERTDTEDLGSHHREAAHRGSRVPDQRELPTGGSVIEVEVVVCGEEDAERLVPPEREELTGRIRAVAAARRQVWSDRQAVGVHGLEEIGVVDAAGAVEEGRSVRSEGDALTVVPVAQRH